MVCLTSNVARTAVAIHLIGGAVLLSGCGSSGSRTTTTTTTAGPSCDAGAPHIEAYGESRCFCSNFSTNQPCHEYGLWFVGTVSECTEQGQEQPCETETNILCRAIDSCCPGYGIGPGNQCTECSSPGVEVCNNASNVSMTTTTTTTTGPSCDAGAPHIEEYGESRCFCSTFSTNQPCYEYGLWFVGTVSECTEQGQEQPCETDTNILCRAIDSCCPGYGIGPGNQCTECSSPGVEVCNNASNASNTFSNVLVV